MLLSVVGQLDEVVRQLACTLVAGRHASRVEPDTSIDPGSGVEAVSSALNKKYPIVEVGRPYLRATFRSKYATDECRHRGWVGGYEDDDVWWVADMRSVGMEWLLIESVNCAERPWRGRCLTGGPQDRYGRAACPIWNFAPAVAEPC